MPNPGPTYLKCWWKMDETSGSRYDEGVGVTLSDSGGVGNANARNAFANLCADFVSSNSEYLYATDPSTLEIGVNNAMFGFWIRPHAIGTNSDILAKWGDANGDQEYIVHIVNSKIRLAVRDENDAYYSVQSDTFGVLSNNEWYFVCCYFQPYIVSQQTGTIGVGVNNVWDTQTVGVYGIQTTTSDFRIGIRDGTGVYFDGEIDDVFFYRDGTGLHPWTAGNRTWLYNNGHGRRFEDANQVAPPTTALMTEQYIPEIYAFDEDLSIVGIIDEYSSLNWAERYNSEGDFELELPLSMASDPRLDFGNFFYIPTSDKIMIVEEKKPTRTPTDAKLLVNGRSAESLLRRRTQIYLQTYLGETAEFQIYSRVYWSVVNPTDADRAIDLFEDGSGDTWPPAMEHEGAVFEQYESKSQYDIIEALAKIVGLGFKIIVSDLTATSAKLYFHTYKGKNRSADQSANPIITFSDSFDNLLDSSFLTTEKDKINITLVKTDDSVYPVVFVWEGGSSQTPGGTEPTGINRFEGQLETSINRDSDGDDVDDLTDADVLAIIEEKGEVVIRENTPVAIFDGDVDVRTTFIIGEDFFLGDLVQVDAHGVSDKARVQEVVRSYTTEGEKIYIAFDFDV